MAGQFSSPRTRKFGRRQASGRKVNRARSSRLPANNVVRFPIAPPPVEPDPVPARAPGRFEFFLIWSLRLSILGVGLGAILGTTLAAVWPQRYLSATPQAPVPVAAPALPPALAETQAIASLHAEFQALAAPKTQLTPGAYFIDLDTGEYVNFRGSEAFSAASTIKVPVLVALFAAIDAGEVSLDEELTMRPDLIGGGSGALQYQPPNSKYSVAEIAEKNIIISDNTATNMLIDRLGGAAVLNDLFLEWGLEETVIRNPLPDLEGTNTTSPRELVKLMALLEQGRLVSPKSRDRILSIMYRTKTRTLLPQGLGQGATIANKTGDIGSMVGDVGLIDMPSGKRYLASVLVARPHNDRNAQELIRAYSRAAYRYFESQPARAEGFIAP